MYGVGINALMHKSDRSERAHDLLKTMSMQTLVKKSRNFSLVGFLNAHEATTDIHLKKIQSGHS